MEELWMSPEEVTVCTQISSGEPPYCLRAQALLALDAGATQAEAAAQSGLTENQVRYWLGRFRSRRLTIFPEGMVTAVSETTAPEAAIDEVVAEAADTVFAEESTGSVQTAVAAKSKKKKKAPSKKKGKGKKENKKKKGTIMKKKKKKEDKKKSAKKKDSKKKVSKKKMSSKKGSKGKNKKSKKKAKKK